MTQDTSTQDSSASTATVMLPGLGVVLVDREAGTLTPRTARAAEQLGLDKPAKRNEDRYKQRMERRRFEAYATNKVGRPDEGWSWRYDADA